MKSILPPLVSGLIGFGLSIIGIRYDTWLFWIIMIPTVFVMALLTSRR